MLKIGIDLHGVIDSNVYKFKSFILACKDVGMTVYIISGPNVEFIKKELQDHKIIRGPHYDGVFSVVDHIEEKGCKIYNSRPAGCRLYPLLFDEISGKAVIDDFCPHGCEFQYNDEEIKKLSFHEWGQPENEFVLK